MPMFKMKHCKDSVCTHLQNDFVNSGMVEKKSK